MIVQELLTRLGFTVNQSALNQYNNQVQDMAKKAVMVGAGIATTLMGGLIKVSAETFGGFESKLQQTAAVSGATKEEMAKLEEQALSLGSSTKFSANEAADAQGELSKAGFNVNQVMSATPGILSLAAAGGLGVGKAAEIASGSINAFGLAAEDAGMVSDLFAMGANKSAIGIEDLGETVKYAAPAFRGAGQNIQDFTALTAIMGNNMIKGSMAGTSLAGGISRLVSPPKEAAAALKKYNIITHDAKGNMLNIVDIAIQMKDKLKGATQQQKSAALTAIFGMEAAKGWNAVLNTSTEEIRKMQTAMHNTNGAAKEMADVMNSGLLPTIDAMKGSIETVAIRIGKQLSPYLIKLANIIADVADWVSNLDPKIHKIIAIIMILTSVVGASILAFAGFKMVVPYIMPVLSALKGFILGINLVNVAIFIVIASLVLFLQDLYVFANGGDSMIGRFLKPFPKIRQTFLEIIDTIKNVYNIVLAAFQNLGLALQQVFGGSGDILEYLIYALLGLGGVVAAVVGFFLLGSATIILALGYIIAFIPTLISAIKNIIIAIATTIAEIYSKVSILIDAISLTLGQMLTYCIGIFQGFINQVIAFFTWGFQEQIPQTFSLLSTIVSDTVNSIQNFFSNMINNIISFFSNAFTNVIPSFISGLGSSIASIGSSISNLITGASNLKATINNTPGIGVGGNNINAYTTVNVGGSNSSPIAIGKAVNGGVKGSLRTGLAGAAKNAVGPVR